MGLILNTSTVIRNLSIGPLSGGGNGGGGYSIPIETSGLALYWDASQYSGTGNTMTDLTGNGNDGIIYGSPSYTSAGDASYFTFTDADASNQTEVILNENSSQVYGMVDNQGMTFSTWVEIPTNLPGEIQVHIGGLGNNSNNTQLFTGANGGSAWTGPSAWKNNTWVQQFNLASLTTNQGNPVGTNDGTWTNSTLVGRPNGQYDVYINGSLMRSRNTDGFIVEASNYVSTIIGSSLYQYYANQTNTNNDFQGKWANVAVYNRPLSATEVLANYNALSSRFS